LRFGIFIYDGVESIDLATFGVLSMARRIVPEIEICIIAPYAGLVTLASGLRVTADFGIDDAPPCDLVIVTGGPGWSAQAEASATLQYIRRVHATGRIASVCTGGMILAASGIRKTPRKQLFRSVARRPGSEPERLALPRARCATVHSALMTPLQKSGARDKEMSC